MGNVDQNNEFLTRLRTATRGSHNSTRVFNVAAHNLSGSDKYPPNFFVEDLYRNPEEVLLSWSHCGAVTTRLLKDFIEQQPEYLAIHGSFKSDDTEPTAMKENENGAFPTFPREIFTEKLACEYLGISPVTLWRERKAKRISFRRIGGSIRYTYSDLVEYVDRCKQPAAV